MRDIAEILAGVPLQVYVARLLPAAGRPDRRKPSEERPSAKRIRDQRLARGEIDLQTYERRRDALDDGGSGEPK